MLGLNQYYWDSLTREVRSALEMSAIQNEKELVVPVAFIEATLMRFNPRDTWASVLNTLALRADNLDVLLKGEWKADILSRNKRSSFKDRVSHSNGIHPLSLDERVDIARLDPSSQEHVQRLTPVYEFLLCARHNSFLPSPYELKNYCYGTDFLLGEINPFVAKKTLEVQGAENLDDSTSRERLIKPSAPEDPVYG